MTTETLVILIGSIVGSSALSVFIKGLFDRREASAKAEGMATDVYQKVINLKNQESLIDKEKIKILEERDKVRELQHNECEQRGVGLQIRLNILESKMKVLNIDLDDVRRFKVFVLDDDEFVQAAYRKKLEVIPIMDVSTFGNLEEIKKRVNEKPDFLVLDYRVHGMTIDEFVTDIIKMERYDPKIILISGIPMDYFNKLPYRGFIWMYFNKEDDYINKPINEIMQYVNEIVKE